LTIKSTSHTRLPACAFRRPDRWPRCTPRISDRQMNATF